MSWKLLFAASALFASSSEMKIRLLLHLGHEALPVTIKRITVPLLIGSFPYILGGVVAPLFLKKDSSALTENTIGRFRKFT